eukprot:CAMPEP_0202951028 /NCGR_PEP_ID=MMETSP1395-20130829/28050_1 /ASSEMBLY_ACC=CAM_ASM_000871 /TAXON_ID=5961 /ORGANISM="Blepharisma japonicum, Strain Stock R1072" /LENGTH=95 /DNA_ID=CAMNT_0049657119 /DNA_START=765 /DNA_END=1052 /DNA_ORIENTATION=+
MKMELAYQEKLQNIWQNTAFAVQLATELFVPNAKSSLIILEKPVKSIKISKNPSIADTAKKLCILLGQFAKTQCAEPATELLAAKSIPVDISALG